MIKSMTAYGRAVFQSDTRIVTIELKSVNNRYFDCSVKLPRSLSPLEEKFRSYIQKKGISRGKIDVYINVNVLAGEAGGVALDEEYSSAYIGALRELRDRFSLPDDISVMRVAANRDVFITLSPEQDPERDWEQLLPVLDEAIDNFTQMRSLEGERLRNDLALKKANVARLANEVGVLAGKAAEGYRARLESKLRATLESFGAQPDEARVLTECAIFADRVAIDEELVRLASHFEAFDEILASDEPVGRKIDFLLQEMNREVNTAGSKCNDADIAHLVVEMKSELEKIREQIQNIE